MPPARIAAQSTAGGSVALAVQEKNAYTTLNALYLSKQYSAALENIQTYLLTFPQSERRDEILYKLGDTYRQLNQPQDALTFFYKLLNEFPNTPYRPYALLRQAELQPTEESLTLLQEVIQNAPTTGLRLNAQFQTIQILQKLKRTSETIPYLEALLQTTTHNPYLAYAHLSLGIWNESRKKLVDALDHYRQALALAETPTMRGEAGVRAGSVAITLKQWKEAVALFETVRRLEIPKNWLQLATLGLLRAQYFSKDYEAVTSTYNNSLSHLPKESRDEILYYLANAFRFTQKNKLALQAYDSLLTKTKNPNNLYYQAAQYERLLILAAESKSTFPQEARSFLQDYPQTSESQTIRYLVGETLFNQKEFSTAIPFFEIILQQGQPKNFLEKTYYQLAWSELFLSQYEQAIKHFEALLQNYPNTSYASESLWHSALAYEQLTQTDPALAKLETILKKYPDSPETEKALLRKGILLNQKTNAVESLQTLNTFLEQYKNSTNAPMAQFYRGLAAFAQKDYPLAIADFEKTREASSQFYTPATEHLLLAHYYLKRPEKVNDYLQDLDALPTKTSSWSLPAEMLFWLAEYQQKQKNWARAETLFQRAQKDASPELQQRAQLNSALTQLEQKKFFEAVKTLELLKKTKLAQSSELLIPLAQAYVGANQLTSASQLAEKIMRNYPEGEPNAKARLVLAEVFMQQKQFDEAAKYYASVALLYDDTNLTLIASKQAAKAYRQAGNEKEAKRMETDYQNQLNEN